MTVAPAPAASPVTYAQTLKPAEVETPLDLFFFRPVAYVFVRLALPTPLSANGMTVLGIVAGLAGAVLYAWTDRAHVVAASALSLLYGILDCADGQLARARGTSSRIGRILDGASDYVVGSVCGVAIALHLSALGGKTGVALAASGLASVLLQGTLFDYFKNRYLTRSGASYREGDDLDETLHEHAALVAERRALASRALLVVYATFLRVQRAIGGAPTREPPRDPASIARYRELLAPVARGWAWLGPSTHVLVMGAAACAGHLTEYVWARLTVGNVVLIALLVEQRRRELAVARGMAPNDG